MVVDGCWCFLFRVVVDACMFALFVSGLVLLHRLLFIVLLAFVHAALGRVMFVVDVCCLLFFVVMWLFVVAWWCSMFALCRCASFIVCCMHLSVVVRCRRRLFDIVVAC